MSSTITLNREQAEAVREYLVKFIYASRAEELYRATSGPGGTMTTIRNAKAGVDEVEAVIASLEEGDSVELPVEAALTREGVRGAFELAAEELHDLINDLVPNAKPDAETLANKVDELSSLIDPLHALENGEMAVA